MECSLTEIIHQLQRAQTIVLTSHLHPDGDSLGSQLALYHYLLSIDKRVYMILDDDVPSLYKFLPGYDKIQRPTERMEVDLLIILDASDKERIGRVSEFITAPTLNIDHHISNKKFADFWYIDNSAAATGEIIYQLLSQMDASITQSIATCIYTAIATDCGFFQYANTTPQTMHIAANLLQYGVFPNQIAEIMETKSFESVFLLADILKTLDLHANGKISTITLTPDIMNKIDNTEGVVNYPRCIEGVEVAVLFKCSNEGSCRVSLRSKTIDVSKVALHFNGGGHSKAAGCTITDNYDNAKRELLDILTKALQEHS